MKLAIKMIGRTHPGGDNDENQNMVIFTKKMLRNENIESIILYVTLKHGRCENKCAEMCTKNALK